jgi:hypothetical protein
MKKEIYKGWKSPSGWIGVKNGTEVGNHDWHIHETKTMGNVTMERHQWPYKSKKEGGGLYWLINGKQFYKLKEAVEYADQLI